MEIQNQGSVPLTLCCKIWVCMDGWYLGCWYAMIAKCNCIVPQERLPDLPLSYGDAGYGAERSYQAIRGGQRRGLRSEETGAERPTSQRTQPLHCIEVEESWTGSGRTWRIQKEMLNFSLRALIGKRAQGCVILQYGCLWPKVQIGPAMSLPL